MVRYYEFANKNTTTTHIAFFVELDTMGFTEDAT